MKIRSIYFLLGLIPLWGLGEIWYAPEFAGAKGVIVKEVLLPEVKCVDLTRSEMDKIGVKLLGVGVVWFVSDHKKCDFYDSSRGEPLKLYLTDSKVLHVELSGQVVSSYSNNRFRHNSLVIIITIMLPLVAVLCVHLQVSRRTSRKGWPN